MADNIDMISSELQSLGFCTQVCNSPRGKIVIFEYPVELGTHKNKLVRIGLSMQGRELYPESPPHWIHISPPIDDGRGGVVEQYTGEDGHLWVVMSRPPGALWDNLLTKHMSGYLSDHVRRFWNDI